MPELIVIDKADLADLLTRIVRSEIERGQQSVSGEFVSPKRAAEMLGVTVGTLTRWRKLPGSAGLPYKIVGGSIRYYKADIIDWKSTKCKAI